MERDISATSDSHCDYDIVIVGGGLVGASLALALQQHELRIALIEAASVKTQAQPNYDDRAIALSYGSRRILEGMGLWPQLIPFTTPIHKIHVSDRGHFGATRINSDAEGVAALGYVITARDLGRTLVEAIAGSSRIDIISPARVTNVEIQTDTARLSINYNDSVTQAQTQTSVFSCQLIVAADGGQSSIRNLLKIDAKQTDYHQTAIIANVSCDKPHLNIAYERFTDTGPIALLPMSPDTENNHRCALVWTQHDTQADNILALDDADFLALLQERFGKRMGRFTKVGKRASHTLHMIQTTEQVRPRLAVIGNAAHTLHPIAGQGFNLGLRDVSTLAQTLVDAQRAGRDPGDMSVLRDYAQWRKHDQQTIRYFTDALVRLFSNTFPPLALARNAGLVATDILPPIKHTLARHTMGIAGKLPRLARGLPL